MTPGARVAAAIAVLDEIQGGAAAEQALTAWARGSRYAGSKDRAAVRDHVFDVLRAKRSLGDGSGRSLMQRLALREGWDIAALFSGDGHAAAPLSAEEHDALAVPLQLSDAARCDVPEWLWPLWQYSLGDQAEAAAITQQGRAAVFLRVNGNKATVAQATQALAQDTIGVVAYPTAPGCLRVTTNPRRIKTSAAYLTGLVELQDAASQEAVRNTPVPTDARVLDYCAGGGGKALAFADIHDATVFAHDIAPQRLRDLPTRAKRAGVKITILPTHALADHPKFDVVFCDAPCSGSGTWRRTPDAKWRLNADILHGLMQSQAEALHGAAQSVASGGILVYATCSVLADENRNIVQSFCFRNPGWQIVRDNQRLPDAHGDGFYTCVLMYP
ncbi:16S rRNA (cytosine967-C5)-methyltransferase [Yoonia maricola]|uniref:16S rRNA (Cytosine967-C5)-methyltransferase n=1 Tax=Yoonia maricola TaxID=420999 RepID=A0A2M8WL56_9RHOB|nr:RsmB/NOP family class I SAM-dependent RNA methyltransferase [Yoonia maricola]PJI91663.1 16S rRNA (cytosine967-C5)-methyltransferase [Yoonia maricola]